MARGRFRRPQPCCVLLWFGGEKDRGPESSRTRVRVLSLLLPSLRTVATPGSASAFSFGKWDISLRAFAFLKAVVVKARKQLGRLELLALCSAGVGWDLWSRCPGCPGELSQTRPGPGAKEELAYLPTLAPHGELWAPHI